MRKIHVISLIYAVLIGFVANSFALIRVAPVVLWGIIPLFLLVNVLPGMLSSKSKRLTLKLCYHGTLLLRAFCLSIVASLIFHGIYAWIMLPATPTAVIWSAVICVAVHVVIFWNGILSVYFTSTQLGIKTRVVGIVCGFIPIANLVALFFIIRTTTREYLFEIEKELLNRKRKDDRICATRYPILLVHGVFFRDWEILNYWGRIPKELEANGANIYYGNHPSALSVADSAACIARRISGILAETGAEKVNIIAHSKGGLDSRYAIAHLGMRPYVASLTTINTPHQGCLFADYLLKKIPKVVQKKVADTYNNTLRKLGDPEPDFMAAVSDLTNQRCQQLNASMPIPQGVYCQSIGSVLYKATNGKFPFNFSYRLVKHFDGDNDGLVSENSFRWGQKYTLLESDKKRGISHADVTDLTRQNLVNFDVREFYVELVRDLKAQGF